MMGSSHLDHYHQEELHGFSSLAAVAAFCDLPTKNQIQILSCDSFVSNANGSVLSSERDLSLSNGVTPVNSHIIQDVGFHWVVNNEVGFVNQQPPAHQLLHLPNIKEGLPENSFPKLDGKYKDPSSDEEYQLHEKLFIRKLASDETDGLQPLPGNLSETSSFDSYRSGDRENLSMAFPTANFPHSNPHPPLLSGSSLDMDLHALDLLASARLGRSFCEPRFAGTALLRHDASSGLDHLQESVQGPFYHHEMPSLVSGVTEAKVSDSSGELDNSSQTSSRKPRFEQRSSFSPCKVRKEKLGDRIAALQQLVAPFGKTDTASVLMEAIGYIKFLLDQVEKLTSVPYMRSSGNKRSRTMQEASKKESNEPKRDLRSKGLCLVPLSCTSYMTSEHGVWSSTSYRGSG